MYRLVRTNLVVERTATFHIIHQVSSRALGLIEKCLLDSRRILPSNFSFFKDSCLLINSLCAIDVHSFYGEELQILHATLLHFCVKQS